MKLTWIIHIYKNMFPIKKDVKSTNAGVCLGRKLSPFSDISQNSMLEKQTLHKIQYKENELFTKFNIRKTDFSQNSI